MAEYSTNREAVSNLTFDRGVDKRLDAFLRLTYGGNASDLDSIAAFVNPNYGSMDRSARLAFRSDPTLIQQALKKAGIDTEEGYNAFLDSPMGDKPAPASGITAAMRASDPTLNPLYGLAETKIVNGVRVDAKTGQPVQQSNIDPSSVPSAQLSGASVPQPPAPTQAANIPTANLQPGMSGPEVLKLQQYLVSQGYMTQAQVDTGPGIYGPQTTAAVKVLQDRLGVDNSTGPGYWGPRTIAAIQQAPSQPTTVGGPVPTPSGSQGTQQPTGTQAPVSPANPAGSPSGAASPIQSFDPVKYGIDSSLWNSLDDATKAFVASTAQILQGQYDQGQANVSINSKLLSDAMKLAESDPDIQAKYGDSLKLAQVDLQKNLGLINQNYTQQMTELEQQQKLQRENLAEQEAAAGRAYSGFREQAKERLATTQSGVIQSSRNALQQKLNELGSSVEGQFGSQALSGFAPIAAGGLSYDDIGGVTGSNVLAKKQDIYNKGISMYQNQKI